MFLADADGPYPLTAIPAGTGCKTVIGYHVICKAMAWSTIVIANKTIHLKSKCSKMYAERCKQDFAMQGQYQWFLTEGAVPSWGGQGISSGPWDLTRFSSIIFFNLFLQVFTTFTISLKSGRLETKDNYIRVAWWRKGKNHWSIFKLRCISTQKWRFRRSSN